MDYQPTKFQFCRLSFACFIDKLRKIKWWRYFMFLGFENLSFVKLNMGYHPSNFQISSLSGSNFMEISVRPLKTLLWGHFLSLSFQISIFCRTWYRLSALQVSMLWYVWIKFYGRGVDPPPQCYEIKKPIAYRVNLLYWKILSPKSHSKDRTKW